VLVTEKRDLAATHRFFTRALEHGPSPSEVSTGRAAAYPRVIEELFPAACQVTEQYANNSAEADHGCLKARLRPMRGLKRERHKLGEADRWSAQRRVGVSVGGGPGWRRVWPLGPGRWVRGESVMHGALGPVRQDSAMSDAAPSPNPVYQLRVVLAGVSPLIWRRLLAPAEATIAELHAVLQAAFGWGGEHLHRFVIHGREYGISYLGGPGFRDDARGIRLGELGLRAGERFTY
jgi:hypothetical protein